MGITLGGRYDYGELRWRITVEMSGTGEGQCNSFRNQKVDSESENLFPFYLSFSVVKLKVILLVQF